MTEQEISLPDWMSAAVVDNTAHPKFRQIAREAAADGLALAKLRTQLERVGFVALPLGTYLRGIAKLAEISWDTICRLAKADPMLVNDQTVRALARFGAAVGFDLRAFRAHCRVGLAELVEGAPIPVLVAHRGKGSASDPLVECEAALFELESDWDGDQRQMARRIEELIRDGFSQDPTE